jgi:hypothetical protein
MNATAVGGGIENLVDGVLTIVNSTIDSNEVDGSPGTGAAFGGGINNSTGTSVVTILNSAITNNTARGGTSDSATAGAAEAGSVLKPGPLR